MRIFDTVYKMSTNILILDPMKAARILLLILLLFPILAYSGEIYGTIKGDNGKPLSKQVIQIIQNEKLIASDTTDTNGYFSVKLKEVGKFKLEIVGFKGAFFDVFSANSSTRYNLILNKTGDQWILKGL
jgi:hypothetical protein